MADLATAGTPLGLSLTDGVGWEVVVQDEIVEVVVECIIHHERIGLRAERQRGKRLRLSPGKDRRTVRGRQVIDLRPDVAHRIEGATVQPPLFR